MAFVETKLGKRAYRIDCAEAQHQRLLRLTGIVEARARALAESGAAAVAPAGEDPELRFLLLTSLLVADRLAKAEDALEALRAERPVIEQAPSATLPPPAKVQDAEVEEAEEVGRGPSDQEIDPALEDALATLLETAADRIVAAAEALERV